jgi:hypothetical protein
MRISAAAAAAILGAAFVSGVVAAPAHATTDCSIFFGEYYEKCVRDNAKLKPVASDNCDSTAGVFNGAFNGCPHCKNVGQNVFPLPDQPVKPCDHNFYDGVAP